VSDGCVGAWSLELLETRHSGSKACLKGVSRILKDGLLLSDTLSKS
jgi:hypothetical protein